MSAEEELRALWASIPDPGCLGLCAESCGPLGMSDLERELLERHTPFAFPQMGAMLAGYMEDPEDYHCPLLRFGRCSAYDDRPTICRLYGAEDSSMRCPWGCAPGEGLLTREEGTAILQRSIDIGGSS